MKGDSCKGGKASKVRLTCLVGSTVLGEKLKPLVIWKSDKPRCFKNVDVSKLGVIYKANKKAWMSEFSWLSEFS